MIIYNVIGNTTRNHLSVNVAETLTTSITTYQGKKKNIIKSWMQTQIFFLSIEMVTGYKHFSEEP